MEAELYQHLREIMPYLGFILFGLVFVGWTCRFLAIQKERLRRMNRLEIGDE